jgi:hypothetical protein
VHALCRSPEDAWVYTLSQCACIPSPKAPQLLSNSTRLYPGVGKVSCLPMLYCCVTCCSAPCQDVMHDCRLHTPIWLHACLQASQLLRRVQPCTLPATTPASGSPVLHTATSAWPHPWCPPDGSHTRPLTQQHLPHTTSAMQSQRSMPLSTHATHVTLDVPAHPHTAKRTKPQQLNMPASSLVGWEGRGCRRC